MDCGRVVELLAELRRRAQTLSGRVVSGESRHKVMGDCTGHNVGVAGGSFFAGTI